MDRVLISIGPITIYYYSFIMLIAIITGIILSLKESKHYNMSKYMDELVTYLIIFGIIGARIYYVIFKFSDYKDNLLDIFKIWEGGIAIYGAIIGGFIAIVYLSKKRNQSIIDTTDIIVPSLIIAQAIGRWGNFFNGEAHGGVVSLEFLQKLHLPQFIINGMYINGEYYHPTFLYESIWCLIGFILLLIIRKISNRKKGLLTSCYFIWYGIGRFFIEGLRTDSLYLFNIRVSQLLSLLLVIGGLIGLILIYKGEKNEKKV